MVKQATHKATSQVRAVKLINKSNLSRQRNATELLFNEYKMLKESVGGGSAKYSRTTRTS